MTNTARTIRLLGGISGNRIHIEETLSIMTIAFLGFFIAWIVMLGYVAFVIGVRQIPLVILQSFIALILLLLLSSLFTVAISLLLRPKTEHLASRKIPFKRFRQLGMATCIMSIILALLIIPSTITSAYILQQLSKEYSLWENIHSNVKLAFDGLDSLETEEMIPKVQAFFDDMKQKNNLCLSLVIDKLILLNKEQYGIYDHLVIADKAWIDSFNIGVGKEDKSGNLQRVIFKNLQNFSKVF